MGASDSKLAFKQSIFGLAGRDDIPHNDSLWPEFYTLPESADDVFSLWSPSDVGCLTLSNKDNRPPPDTQTQPNKNLETLIYILIARLRTLQATHVFAPDDQRSTSLEILNCMRILTRMMPFIYEAQHIREWRERFFWQSRKPTYFWDKRGDKPGQLFDGLDPSKTFAMEDFDTEIGPPLGETLLDICVKYLFFPGFTIPKRTDPQGKPDLDFVVRVWQTGIGNSRSLGCSKENEKHQQETVRLILAVMSETMYMPPHEIASANIKPLTYMTTRLEKRVINGILCSLLNTVLKYNPNMWSVPLEMATGTNDYKKLLVTNCLQLILVLMVYEPPKPLTNQFRLSMGSLHRPDDFQFIQQGTSQVLSQPVSGTFNYSLSKEKALPWAPEMISFLWELIQCNKRFRRYLIDTSSALDYVILVLFYAVDAKDDPSKHGILRMCIFLLQTMSVEERFAIKLNNPFRHPESLPSIMRIPNFHGTYTDFLICSLHTIFTTTRGRLDSIYPAMLAIVKNVAPQQKFLARATSSKLTSLFEMFSAPDFLLANDSNHVMLFELLNAMNSILENHFDENRRFVEVLVASRKKFRALAEFTIEGALAEIDRQAQERKDRGDASSVRIPTASNTSSFENSRGPAAAASAPSLHDVPEDERFAIGDEDEDEDDAQHPNNAAASNTNGHENVPPPTVRTLSDKARGKQPASIITSLSPPSRTPSTASLPPISTLQSLTGTSLQQSQFRPSHEWLDGWYPLVLQKLEPIFHIIELAEKSELKFKEPPPTSDGDAPKDERRPSQFENSFNHANAGDQTPMTPITPGAGTLGSQGSFQWTALAIGWYTALIWSRVYLSEAETFQGSGGLYSSTNVLLFKRGAVGREISLRSPRGAIDAVGDGIVKRISSINISGK